MEGITIDDGWEKKWKSKFVNFSINLRREKFKQDFSFRSQRFASQNLGHPQILRPLFRFKL